jgi:hypothetical protein
MKTIQKMLLTGFFTLALGGAVQAQTGSYNKDYSTAIGVRAGWTSGLTIKQFVGPSLAVEGMISAWPRDLSATLLLEKHQSISGARGLSLYYGGGGHARFFTHRYREVYYHKGRYWYATGSAGTGMGVGIDGVLGIEYKIPDVPVAFSLDLKPFFEVGSDGYFLAVPDAGLGVKVAF